MAPISADMEKLINQQIAHEYSNAMLYLNMGGAFHKIGLEGFAALYDKHAKEEQEHAERFAAHVRERNGRVAVVQIPDTTGTWKDPLAILEATYKREIQTTERIDMIYNAAVAAKDYQCQQMLDWFEAEQISEEREAWEMMEQVRMIGGEDSDLVLYDMNLREDQ